MIVRCLHRAQSARIVCIQIHVLKRSQHAQIDGADMADIQEKLESAATKVRGLKDAAENGPSVVKQSTNADATMPQLIVRQSQTCNAAPSNDLLCLFLCVASLFLPPHAVRWRCNHAARGGVSTSTESSDGQHGSESQGANRGAEQFNHRPR